MAKEPFYRLPNRESWWIAGRGRHVWPRMKVDVCRFNGEKWDVILEYPINGYIMPIDDFWALAQPVFGTIEEHSHEISPEQYERKNAQA